jgi:ssDNA-binding Zn-finger/Zn-ribbon topoisomerase 1
MPPKKKSSKFKKQPIPEDFELSDDEPTMIKLNKEQKLTSKNIIFYCPLCHGKLQLRNEIEINPKGITCRCNPCSFKLTKNDKIMNVSKDDEGGISLDSQDHSISFSWNRITTPPTDDEKSKNEMIKDVVMGTPRSAGAQSATSRSGRKQVMNEMD